MCCFRLCRYGQNHCNCGCGCGCNNSGYGCGSNGGYSCGGSNSGCGCSNDGGCGYGCGSNNGYGCGCSCGGGSNSGCGGHDIYAGARRQVYREDSRNDYWEGFSDATWGNPGYDGPTLRTAGGPGPAITEGSCDCNN